MPQLTGLPATHAPLPSHDDDGVSIPPLQLPAAHGVEGGTSAQAALVPEHSPVLPHPPSGAHSPSTSVPAAWSAQCPVASQLSQVPAQLALLAAARTFGRGRRGAVVCSTGPSFATRSNLSYYLALCINTLCGRWVRAGERAPFPNVLLPAFTPRTRLPTVKRCGPLWCVL